MSRTTIAAILAICCGASARSDDLAWLDAYNVVWTSPSNNSGESMPCAGGDIGLNVWVENGELLFYIGRAGCRDENGALLKPGRCRIRLTPNPFEHGSFRQELKLRHGCVYINAEQPGGAAVSIKVWAEVSRPIVHVDIESDKPLTAEATYESWRTGTIELSIHVVDWMPTLAKLAGYKPKSDLNWDGTNIWPWITRQKMQTAPRTLYWKFTNRAMALRHGDWKLILPGKELFNLADDPYEKRNLAGSERARVAELLERLARARKLDVLKRPSDVEPQE